MPHPDTLGAVARGWCTPENAKKEMDSDLAYAIAEEVDKLVDDLKGGIEELNKEIFRLDAEIKVLESWNSYLQQDNRSMRGIWKANTAQEPLSDERRTHVSDDAA